MKCRHVARGIHLEYGARSVALAGCQAVEITVASLDQNDWPCSVGPGKVVERHEFTGGHQLEHRAGIAHTAVESRSVEVAVATPNQRLGGCSILSCKGVEDRHLARSIHPEHRAGTVRTPGDHR